MKNIIRMTLALALSLGGLNTLHAEGLDEFQLIFAILCTIQILWTQSSH